MQKPILVVMAAGMGSRYGGLKQIDPVGKNGEIIMDFSVFDAMRAGFSKVVFIIKEELYADFRAVVGDRVSRYMPVEYAFQRLEDLPAGFAVPEGRVKPWGTGHAVLAARGHIDAPFVVINADDFYGAEAFAKIGAFLQQAAADGEKSHWAMVRGARPSPSVPRRMASFSAARSRGSSMLRAVLSRAMAAVWKPSSFSLSSPGWGHWDASVPRKVQGIWNRVPMLTRTARRLRGSQQVGVTSTASICRAAAERKIAPTLVGFITFSSTAIRRAPAQTSSSFGRGGRCIAHSIPRVR